MDIRGLNFLKVSGTGNDFVVVMNFENKYDYNWSNLARILCRRHFSVGADGLVVLEKSQKADARMRIFNPDGSEAEMCGNAARCAARVLVKERIISSDNVELETISGIITAQVKGDNVKIKMTQPHSFRDGVHIRIENMDYTGSFINTGVPHTVFFTPLEVRTKGTAVASGDLLLTGFTDDIEKIDLLKIGPNVRYDKQFRPEGTNVNFVQIMSNNSISMRTYERGVENETYACGTGAVASSVIGYLKGLLKARKITVLTKGGELSVELEEKDGEVKDVYLESPVKIVYSAEYLGEGENV